MNPRALICHPEPAAAALLSALAQRAGYATLTDTCGRVVELIQSFRPQLLLLDVDQQGGAGLELLALLRLRASTRLLPVIATGSRHDGFARAVSEELGALAYVSQPFPPDLLVRCAFPLALEAAVASEAARR